MGTTFTPRGWPIPDRAERATVPTHLQALANAIDNDVTTQVTRIDGTAKSAQSQLDTHTTRLDALARVAGLQGGGATDGTVAALLTNASTQTATTLAQTYAPLSEVQTRAAADSALGDRATGLETRAKSLEDWRDGNAWRASTVKPTPGGWAVEGVGVLVYPHAEGRACVWSGNLRRAADTFTIPASAWFDLGPIAPAPSPKSGTVGQGIGQAGGTAFEVQITDAGRFRLWPGTALTMGKSSGTINFSVTWIAGS